MELIWHKFLPRSEDTIVLPDFNYGGVILWPALPLLEPPPLLPSESLSHDGLP